MTYALSLQDATAENNGEITFRAIVFKINKDGVRAVHDIIESSCLNNLRTMPAIKDATMYFSRSGHAYVGYWGDALRVLKENLHEAAVAEGAYDLRKSAKPADMVAARLVAVDARNERERLNAERDAELARAQNERDELTKQRADFDAWRTMIRAAQDSNDDEFRLAYVMQEAFSRIEQFPARLEDYTKKVAENPTYALSWSGDFVQASHHHKIAQELVLMFNDGMPAADIKATMRRELMRNVERSTSRSTSVMSNLCEDCERAAIGHVVRRFDY